jgi:tetratricopeptide (TPR) repeat protein
MIATIRHLNRATAALAALFLLSAFVHPAASAADKDKDKKPEKEKKEKVEPWVEIRTTHFIVASDGGEKTARRFADQFEALLRIFQATMPKARVTNGIPARILVAKDGKSFARVVPESPFSKNHDQPAGIFVAGPEKTYLALRANAEGKFVYSEIFHSYAREVLKLSHRNLPPWIEEGYSSVYRNLRFTDRGPRLERPDPDDMSTLFLSPLLPLDIVLGADRTSPYYSPGNTDSVYSAESRVLLQFLITDSKFAGTKAMEQYLTDVENQADLPQSTSNQPTSKTKAAGQAYNGAGSESPLLQEARRAFGDLTQLQSSLDAYIKLVNGPPHEFPASGGNDAGGAARTLTPAETETRLADFFVLRGRDSDAEDKLDDAIMSEPSLAEAEQCYGFLLLKRNDLAEAEKHFQRAAQLDPKDSLNFYGLGVVGVEKAGKTAVPASAIDALEKSVTLNPDFAAAWYNLSKVYAQRDDTLAKALTDIQRAAALEPGEYEYQLQMATLLNQMGRADEARNTAAHVKETASDRTMVDKAGDLIARMSRPQSNGAPAPPKAAPAKASVDPTPRLERKTEQDAKPASTAPPPPAPSASAPIDSKTSPAAAAPPASPRADSSSVYARMYSMVGKITDVNCAGAPQVQLTLSSISIALKLHADDLEKIAVKTEGSATAAKGAACTTLRGRSARISYHLVSDKAWDGEIQEVELRTEP